MGLFDVFKKGLAKTREKVINSFKRVLTFGRRIDDNPTRRAGRKCDADRRHGTAGGDGAARMRCATAWQRRPDQAKPRKSSRFSKRRIAKHLERPKIASCASPTRPRL
jgi:hypothetical protein